MARRLCLLPAGALAVLIVCASAAAEERAVTFPPRGDDAFSLEGLLHKPPADNPLRGVVVCHPDPRYGGSMTVPVAAHLQRVFADAGFATLRFNLRGVGRSGGQFDAGKGEVRDCLGALDFLRAQAGIDPKRVALVGYSFGSWVGLQACARDGRVPVCGCLGFPVPAGEDLAGHPYFAKIRFPTLFLTGTEDTISSLQTIRRLVETYKAGKCCTVRGIEGADHFFLNPPDLAAAGKTMVQFIAAALDKPVPGPDGDD